MTWSCLIASDRANPHGLETLKEANGNFRVKIRPDGVSDWIAHLGDRCPAHADVKVSVRFNNRHNIAAGVRADVVNWSLVNAFRVHGTPEAAEPAKPQGRYMVSVDGQAAPKQEHDTVEDAIAEAQRVGSQPANVLRTVRVLQVVATLPPVGERQVVMAGEAA